METSNVTILASGQAVLRKEAEALAQLSTALDENFVRAVQILTGCQGHIVVVGVGKSGHIAKKIAATMSSLNIPALFLHAVEAVHGDMGVIRPDDILVLISYSGESGEILNLLPHFEQLPNQSIAITGNPASSLARYATVHLDIGVRSEADPRGLVPTTSSTATLALGDALALTVADMHGFTREQFRKNHPGGSLGKKLSASK